MTDESKEEGRWVSIDDPVFVDPTDPLFRFQVDYVLTGQNPPERLYHYTTADGLLGILESRTVWATHINYLNDKHELHHAEKVLSLELRERAERSDVNVEERQALLAAAESLEKHRSDREAYVFSLTENGDQLSQWRAYGSSATGYSLGW